MPIARYQMPDGRIARFEVPEGTTPEQAQQYAEQFFAKQKLSSPTDVMSTTQRLLAGAGKSFYDVARGAGQLVGMVSDKDIQEATALDKPLMETTAGTVGNVGGHMALSSALGVPKSILGAAALGAGYSGLQSGTPQERAMNAIVGGTWALARIALRNSSRGCPSELSSDPVLMIWKAMTAFRVSRKTATRFSDSELNLSLLDM